MKKLLLSITALTFSLSILAQSSEKEFAQYGVSLTASPFGPGINYSYNFDLKTSLSVGFGGTFGESDVSSFGPKVDELGDYEWETSSSWMGVFMAHRPFEKYNWFVVNAGFAIGGIENHIHAESGNEYQVDYNENPVGYFGFSARSGNVKGLQFGVEIGTLYSSGPDSFEGSDSLEADAILEKLTPNVLPNFQLSIGYGF
ncbi:MAG: hypothetical protein CMP57_04530 [Flavobacteriales bacterium]|nr:hypothetical protein [Flavobacteriales bacterium]|tara:strand:- start:436 stop:1035 length:600 start_codon:yes stop_codon:yes gene_type:complete